MSENPALIEGNASSAPKGRRGVPAVAVDPSWGRMAEMPVMPADGPNLSAYLHALRRRWLPAVLLGLICGAAAWAGVWFGRGALYQASAYLLVSVDEPRIIYPDDRNQRALPNAFDIYKDTQAQLVRSRFVLGKALARDDIRVLPSVRREQDPVTWLEQELRVSYPGKAQFMQVSLTGPDRAEVTRLVNAVVDTYLKEVVDVERNGRLERLNQLDRAFTEKETEVRNKMSALKQLAQQLGTGDEEALRLKQQLAVQELSDYRRELIRTQFQLQQAEGERAAVNEMLAKIEDLDISLYEVDNLVRQDPVASDIAKQLAFQRQVWGYTSSVIRPDAQEKYAAKSRDDLQALEAMFQQRSEELREGVRSLKRSELEEKQLLKEIDVAMLTQREKQLRAGVEQKEQQAARLSESSIDLEMMRSEIDQLGRVLADITAERERIRVELRSAPRVTPLQMAQEPLVEDGLILRVAMSGLAGLAAFLLPIGLITWWDTQAQRVNTLNDVQQRFGMRVVGTVPEVPARVIRRLGSARGQSRWQARLTEAVDGIVARLLHRAEHQSARVVLVTSAVAGEAKSTLATQLAASLARNGRSTVLVDFALRRPALNRVFGAALEPGVSEVLRGECELAAAVHPTAAEHLALITAGSWDRQALSALANGACRALFEELRNEYDFVVVDSSPVLPVADTRFVSQHVDVVLLSVVRDLSQAPKLRETLDILEAFGVSEVEAVVTGAGENLDTRSLAHQRPPAK